MNTANAPNAPNPLLQQSEQFAKMAEEMYYFSVHFLRAYEILMAMLNGPKTMSATPAESQAPISVSASAPQEPVKPDVVSTADASEANALTGDERPKAITLPDVRRRMTVAAQTGHVEQVKRLLGRYGAEKLSDIDPAQYQAFLADLDDLMKSEVLTNG